MVSLITDKMVGVMEGLAISRPEGCFVEVGVYQGGSAKVLYGVAERQKRALYLYDTFEGMPFCGVYDTHPVGMFKDCSVDDIRAAMPNAVVCKGIFPESFRGVPPVAFVHADADQYQSTLDICNTFGPLMVKGGMMLFDDYYCVASCIKAVDECFPNREILPDGRALVCF